MDIEPNRGGQPDQSLAMATGDRVAEVEDGVIRRGTAGVYRFRVRHPWVYGLIAYIIGSGLIAIVTVISYGSWAFQGVNLKAAVYELVGGAFAGGVVMVVLAFSYARTVRPTIVSTNDKWDLTRAPQAKG